ncbi:hypothetical protein Vretimale_18904 [Volvox reticuliferus]|uniref:Uncharacterized protein n=1 Tax=Volvox reticuliferus TaxID=1737510 RepID=A0A8J4GZQ6_9CHLO|nr:hypothetical protein Vretimale_18904 [Volvox reticuliferus]
MGLVTFGAPYQYAQDMPGHNLWQANIRFIPCLHRDAGPLGVLAANVPIGAGHRTELYMCRCGILFTPHAKSEVADGGGGGWGGRHAPPHRFWIAMVQLASHQDALRLRLVADCGLPSSLIAGGPHHASLCTNEPGS